MTVGSGTLNIDANDWATSSTYIVTSIDVVTSGAGVLVLNDKHGNEIFRATSAAAESKNYVLNQEVIGIAVATWTNMTVANVHIKT